MARFKLANYLITFAGEDRRGPDKVFRAVADAGWDAVEGQLVQGAAELVELATVARKLDAPYPPRPAAEAAKCHREYLRSLGYER